MAQLKIRIEENDSDNGKPLYLGSVLATRTEYLSGKCANREFYSQFVTPGIRSRS